MKHAVMLSNKELDLLDEALAELHEFYLYSSLLEAGDVLKRLNRLHSKLAKVLRDAQKP